MGGFVPDILPVELLYWPGLEGGITPPPVAPGATPDGKIEQRIRTASEGRYSITFPAVTRDAARWQQLYEFNLSVGGRENSFRALDPREYFNRFSGQVLGVGDGATAEFQLIHVFGTYAHTVDKPVPGEVRVYIDGIETAGFVVGEFTGIVQIDNLTGAITAATSTNPCQLTKGAHGLETGDTAYLSAFTGDWAALNGQRYPVTRINANVFSIPVDTSGFTPYSGNGGVFHTLPQEGEVVSADAQHYYQVRFDSEFRGPEVVLNRAATVAGIVLLEVRE